MRISWTLVAFGLLLAAIFMASLVIGEVHLSLREVLLGLMRTEEGLSRTLLWDIRLPRALSGIAVGAALAASGVLMQAFFRNALASPGLLGVSSGGAFAAVLALALGWTTQSLWMLPLASILGAFFATAAVMGFARRGASTEHLLLAGVALNALLGAGTSFILSITAGQFHVSGQILFWLMGGLENRTWEHVAMGLPGIAITCVLVLPLGRSMNLLALGESGAQSLGVNVRRLRWKIVIFSTILTALATAIAGIVGFVGLVIPHILRLALGPDHRRLLPLSMLAGASFLLACDLATRVLPAGLRLGVVTALVGGPFFLWLLRRTSC